MRTNQSAHFVSNHGNPCDVFSRRRRLCVDVSRSRMPTTVAGPCQELKAGQNEGPSVSPRRQSALKPILQCTAQRRLCRPRLHPRRWLRTLLSLQLVRLLLLLLPSRSWVTYKYSPVIAKMTCLPTSKGGEFSSCLPCGKCSTRVYAVLPVTKAASSWKRICSRNKVCIQPLTFTVATARKLLLSASVFVSPARPTWDLLWPFHVFCRAGPTLRKKDRVRVRRRVQKSSTEVKMKRRAARKWRKGYEDKERVRRPYVLSRCFWYWNRKCKVTVTIGIISCAFCSTQSGYCVAFLLYIAMYCVVLCCTSSPAFFLKFFFFLHEDNSITFSVMNMHIIWFLMLRSR